jgi:hypothetical protein
LDKLRRRFLWVGDKAIMGESDALQSRVSTAFGSHSSPPSRRDPTAKSSNPLASRTAADQSGSSEPTVRARYSPSPSTTSSSSSPPASSSRGRPSLPACGGAWPRGRAPSPCALTVEPLICSSAHPAAAAVLPPSSTRGLLRRPACGSYLAHVGGPPERPSRWSSRPSGTRLQSSTLKM